MEIDRGSLRKHVSSVEVAKLAGVSQSTVSRVFTPGKKVSEKTRRQVLEAANKLNYRPNALARGLIMKKTNMIGLVIGNIQNPYYSEILEKFTLFLEKIGYHVLFVHTKNNEIREDQISHFIEYNVDGIIITDALLSSTVVKKLLKYQIPVVLFNRDISDSGCYFVGCDNYTAGMKIGEYLYNFGHRKIAFITGHENTSTSNERQKGFSAFINKKGINPIIESGGYSYEEGHKSALRLLKTHHSIDAIFCADDIMAIGAIDAINSLGLSIPKDISIIGFDNIIMSSWKPYSLTTWDVPIDEMIKLSVKILLGEIEGENKFSKRILVPGNLIERNTVGKRERVL